MRRQLKTRTPTLRMWGITTRLGGAFWSVLALIYVSNSSYESSFLRSSLPRVAASLLRVVVASLQLFDVVSALRAFVASASRCQ